MMKDIELIDDYWTTQAEAFTKISFDELTSGIYDIWFSILAPKLANDKALSVLDVGCGAGFFEMVIGRWGHHITAVDYNEKMLEEAVKNTNAIGLDNPNVSFSKMDAQKLSFDDGQFDLVISRNLTWVLEKPDEAYKEWIRVLKPGGELINFDANWFLHLNNEEAEKAYERGVAAALKKGFTLKESDHGNEFDKVLHRLPLTEKKRPQWDLDILLTIGCEKISVHPRLPNQLYDDYHTEIYKEIPTFMIEVIK